MDCIKPFYVEYWHVFQHLCQKKNLPSQFMNMGVTVPFVPHIGYIHMIPSFDTFWNSGLRPEMKHFTNLHQYLDVKRKTWLAEKQKANRKNCSWFPYSFFISQSSIWVSASFSSRSRSRHFGLQAKSLSCSAPPAGSYQEMKSHCLSVLPYRFLSKVL